MFWSPKRLWKRRGARIGALLCVGIVASAIGIGGAAWATSAEGSPPPTIASDKPDYAPGETVTLSGANWQPGESVHVFVNDDVGQTWSHSADVVAAADGTITDQFQLPDWFVALYSVTATGPDSGTVRSSFTDANAPAVTIQSVSKPTVGAGDSTNIVWKANQDADSWNTRVGGTDCSTGTVVDSGGAYNKNDLPTTPVSASSLSEGPNTIRICVTTSPGTGSAT